jgi:hypothetical protein
MSVSRNADFLFGGNAEDLGLDFEGIYNRMYVYELETRHFSSDMYDYDEALYDRGFGWQGDFTDDDGDIWEYFYNTANNISVTYCYAQELELMIILIGTGNAYEQFYGSPGIGTTPPPVPGYVGFPLVPDVGLLVQTAEYIDSGYFFEWGADTFFLGGNLYIVSEDFVYMYSFPRSRLADSTPFYYQLFANGFEELRESEYAEDHLCLRGRALVDSDRMTSGLQKGCLCTFFSQVKSRSANRL